MTDIRLMTEGDIEELLDGSILEMRSYGRDRDRGRDRDQDRTRDVDKMCRERDRDQDRGRDKDREWSDSCDMIGETDIYGNLVKIDGE